MEAHLKECPHCRHLLEQVTHNRKIMHQLPSIQISDNFYFKLRNRILAERYHHERNKSLPLWRLQRIPSYVYGFALALLAIVVGITILDWQEPESPINQLPPTLQGRLQQPPVNYPPTQNPNPQDRQQPAAVASRDSWATDGDSISQEENVSPETERNFQDKIKTVKDQR